jgi:hypothetical protein
MRSGSSVHASALTSGVIPDRSRARGEMSRVTRAGGTVAAAVWDDGEGMAMLRVFWDEAVALDPFVDPSPSSPDAWPPRCCR